MSASSDTTVQAPSRAPWLWIAVLALLVIITRLWMSSAVSWDQNEQLVWSQRLRLGYGPQPPLYTWLQWAVNLVLGPTTLAVVLVKNSLIALTFVFMLLAARQVLPERTAWLAAAGLAWLPGIGWQLLRDQTHTVMLTCAIACTWWLVLRHIRNPRPLGFVWIGLAVAWGILSKYSYALVAVALLVAALTVPAPRRALLSRGFWLAPLVTLTLVAPHAWWVLEHWDKASGSTLDKLHPADTPSRLHGLATGSGDLLAFLLLAVLPWLLMAVYTLGRFWKTPQTSAAPAGSTSSERPSTLPWVEPLLRHYAIVVVGVLALMVLAGASKFDGRWIQPLLLMAPLWVLSRWPQAGDNERGARRYLAACLAMLVLMCSIAMLAPLRDAQRGNGDRLNWQLDAIATSLRQAGFNGQGMILAEHHTTGGVLHMLFPQAKVVVCDADDPGFHLGCAWRKAEKARAKGLPLLQVSTETPAPDAWWWAAWPIGSMPERRVYNLPYRWTDPDQARMKLEFIVYPADPSAAVSTSAAAHPALHASAHNHLQ